MANVSIITKEMIRAGIDNGVVRFITDPNLEAGTVCAIGQNWFYFGGTYAEEETPEEFLAHADMEEVIRDIWDALEDFRDEGPEDGEYEYYCLCLEEAIDMPDPFEDRFVYLQDKKRIIHVQEGSGEALSKEDREAGYADYLDYTIHRIGGEMEEEDGGLHLTKQEVRSRGSLDQWIPELIKDIYDDTDVRYVVLQRGMKTPGMQGLPEGYDDMTVYVPMLDLILQVSEGDGTNLTDEDIEDGYQDYIYFCTRTMDAEFQPEGGGCMPCKKPVRETYKSIAECIPDVVRVYTGDPDANARYLVL